MSDTCSGSLAAEEGGGRKWPRLVGREKGSWFFSFSSLGKDGCLFLQNEGVLGVFEEAANERKTLETDEIPHSQTPEECRVAPGLCRHELCPSPSAETHRHAPGSGVKVGNCLEGKMVVTDLGSQGPFPIPA